MKVERKSKFYVFLMEYLWSILFFVLACIVCVQLFVESYRISNLASDKNEALLIGQVIAEDLRMNAIDEADGFILIEENHYQKNTDKFVIDIYQTPKALDYVESTIEVSKGHTVLINFTVMSGGQ
ncbi:hypothetical protein [Anaerorhabdus sp.]|uniref:hypothetical protein n=1 Tax=Anaerorhabdus sp. TaxID=1872524 RepID=UPI002B202428|nr:hypothetical protein [Anaerorhabdus sp.]MEA4874591.1 hypothetical protein [Anaerorhabdus sp.]